MHDDKHSSQALLQRKLESKRTAARFAYLHVGRAGFSTGFAIPCASQLLVFCAQFAPFPLFARFQSKRSNCEQREKQQGSVHRFWLQTTWGVCVCVYVCAMVVFRMVSVELAPACHFPMQLRGLRT
jgi:hypothetical protein